jgi:hypothetical protein
MSGCRHGVGIVIFLLSGSGQRMNRIGMRQRLVFQYQRGSGVLRHHQPGIQSRCICMIHQHGRQTIVQVDVRQAKNAPFGNGRQLRQRNGEKVQHHTHWFAVKIAAG